MGTIVSRIRRWVGVRRGRRTREGGVGRDEHGRECEWGNRRKKTLSGFVEEKEVERERERTSATARKKRAGNTTSSNIQHRQHTQYDMDNPFSTTILTTTSASITSRFSNSVLKANLAFRPHTSLPDPPSAPGQPIHSVSFNLQPPRRLLIPHRRLSHLICSRFCFRGDDRPHQIHSPSMGTYEHDDAASAFGGAVAEAEAERDRKQGVVGTKENEQGGAVTKWPQGSANLRGRLSS